MARKIPIPPTLAALAALDAEKGNWLLDALVRGMREGLLIVDSDRRIVAANDALRRSLSSGLEPVGRLQSEVFRDPHVVTALEESLVSGEGSRRRIDDRARTARIFDLQVTPLGGDEDGAPHAVVALFYDISRLETLESVRQTFIADVSHELRTPLTSIKAAVETLLDEVEATRDVSLPFLEMIDRQARRMEALVDDLGDLSRIETGSIALEPRDVDLDGLVTRLTDDVAARAAEARVTVRSEVPAEFVIHADPRRLEQMLVNLIENAIKFNRPGGEVAVSAKNEQNVQVIEVADTGIGIPPESVEKVFHRFFRVDVARSREGGGTGLGLAIVKHLMQLHGGRVSVSSELGEGSRFALAFVRQPMPVEPDQSAELSDPAS